MFVPDPVISLAIKPAGKETPNFSRALNRFQKEDPTFKVHLDHESKEVRPMFIRAIHFVYDDVFLRPSSLEWVSYTLRSMLSACVENTTLNALSENHELTSVKRSRGAPTSITSTRSKQVVQASMRR